MGLVFLALAFTGEFLNRIFFSRESFTTGELVHLGVACVFSGAATLLNPYGIKLPVEYFPTFNEWGCFPYVFRTYDKYILAYVSLWPYLKNTGISFFNAGLTAWIMTVMILTVFILSIYELVKKRSCDFALLIISFALYWKGMETSRASYFFPIAFFFVFFYLLIHRMKLEVFSAGQPSFPCWFFFSFCQHFLFQHQVLYDGEWFASASTILFRRMKLPS